MQDTTLSQPVEICLHVSVLVIQGLLQASHNNNATTTFHIQVKACRLDSCDRWKSALLKPKFPAAATEFRTLLWPRDLIPVTSARKINHVNKTDTNLKFRNTVKHFLSENLCLAENFHTPEGPNFKYHIKTNLPKTEKKIGFLPFHYRQVSTLKGE
jgi:hypothetical protein